MSGLFRFCCFLILIWACLVSAPVYAACTSPESDSGTIIYNQDHKTLQWCDGAQWIELVKNNLSSDPCGGATPPSIGTVCGDGSVYAGLTGAVKMWTTPADAPGTYQWGSHGTWRYTTSTNGLTNTNTLASFGAAAHPAAHYCYNLTAHGRTDWHLPSIQDLELIYSRRVAIGGYTTNWYHSSNEANQWSQWIVNFNDGLKPSATKNSNYRLRCIRRGEYVGTSCVSPSAPAGTIIYNDDHRVMQWCDGNGWKLLGPVIVDPCTKTANPPVPGTVCVDGSLFAGYRSDGSSLYATPKADVVSRTWNSGGASGNSANVTGLGSDGRVNTDILVATDADTVEPGFQNHNVAHYCNDLNLYGHSDWYSPSRHEVNILYKNRSVLGGLDFSGQGYWSSEQTSGMYAYRLSGPSWNAYVEKHMGGRVHCVRRNSSHLSLTDLNVQSGLTGHWRLNSSAGTVAADSSPSSVNLNLTNMTVPDVWVQGVVGNALDFDGSNDHAFNSYNPTSNNQTPAISGCAWLYSRINQSRSAVQWRRMGDAALIFRPVVIESNSSRFSSFIRLGPGDITLQTPDMGAGYWNNKWHHVCTVFDRTLPANRLKIYVNGEVAAQSDAYDSVLNHDSFSASARLTIGGDTHWGQYFNGMIDDVRIYNRALSAREVQILYTRSACANPEAPAGEIIYNADHGLIQYCNGTGWVAIK